MRRRWLMLLPTAAVLAAMGGCAYTGMYRYPWFTTAKSLHQDEWDFEGSVSPFEHFCTNGTGYSNWPFRPELGARVGLGNHLQVGLSTDFAPGLGIEGQYQFGHGMRSKLAIGPDSVAICPPPRCIFGRPKLAVGARAAYYLNSNLTAVEGVYDVSPRFLISSERPKTIPYALNLGLDYYGYNGFKANEGGTTPSASALSVILNVGLPLNFKTPIKLDKKLSYNVRVQPALAFNFQVAGSTGYKASFTEVAGISTEVDAIDYRTGNEDRIWRHGRR